MPDYREIFQNVRQGLQASFPHRQESIADLLNALSSNDHAPSVAALSLNPNYQRQYATLYWMRLNELAYAQLYLPVLWLRCCLSPGSDMCVPCRMPSPPPARCNGALAL